MFTQVKTALKELWEEHLFFHYKPQTANRNFYFYYYDGIELRIDLKLENEKDTININDFTFSYNRMENRNAEIKLFLMDCMKKVKERERIPLLFKEKNYFFNHNTPSYDDFVLKPIHSILKKYYSIDTIEEYCTKMTKTKEKAEKIETNLVDLDIYLLKRLDHYFLVIERVNNAEIFHFFSSEKEKAINEYKKYCKIHYEKQLEEKTKKEIEDYDNF